MRLIRCEKGHVYDSDTNTQCPHCQPAGLRKMQPAHANEFAKGGDDPVTIPIYKCETQPVIGWLVCVSGPEQGCDYRLYAGRNFAGNDPKMQICISGDSSIAAQDHFSVVYDPKSNRVFAMPGKYGKTKVCDKELTSPVLLSDGDRIQAGNSMFDLVCYCKEGRHW